jgi:hypothetical protein
MASNRTRYGIIVLGCASLNVSACWKRGDPPEGTDFEEPPATAIEELVVRRVGADLSKPDPMAAYWKEVPRGAISLTAQPMIAPRPETTNTELLAVQAVHDGKQVAFRIVWSDPDMSQAGRLGEFSDALALQFPVNGSDDTPVMMGSEGLPVHIFHWRAQYQRDKEKGKPKMTDLYPNASIDMYAMDFKDAPGGSAKDKESFSPGVAEGNPQSYQKNGIDEIVAEGFSTSAVREGHSSAAQGVWKNGRWALVIARPLAIEGGSVLKPGVQSYIAFAAWQGGKGEVGSRKSVTMSWLPIQLQ